MTYHRVRDGIAEPAALLVLKLSVVLADVLAHHNFASAQRWKARKLPGKEDGTEVGDRPFTVRLMAVLHIFKFGKNGVSRLRYILV